jgi:hypothetical protein
VFSFQFPDRAYRIGQKRDVQVLRLVARGTIDELKYLRQLYKIQLKQETLEKNGPSAPKAARMFRGVEGDKHRKGELFGYENLLRFKDGCFLHDIWKQTGIRKHQRKTGDVEIHAAASLADELIGMGDEKRDEVLNGPSSNLDELLRSTSISEERDGDWMSKTKNVKTNLEASGEMNEADEANAGALEIEAQALNHEDLFRDDRGRAAIEEGEDGFDEEMGGGTQNAVAIYEGGVCMPDNPQDGSISDAGNMSDQNREDDHADIDNISLQHRHREDERRTQQQLDNAAAGVQNHERLGDVRDRSHAATRNETVVERLQPSLHVPAEDSSLNMRVEVEPLGDQPAQETSLLEEGSAFASAALQHGTSNDQRKPAVKTPRNIKLVGIVSTQMAQNPLKTTFSAHDLPLPTYRPTKSKKRKKKAN